MGTDYPYDNPILTINLFNEDSLNFYLTSSGYYQSKEDISILWIFDNLPDTIFSSEIFSISKDGKTIFFESFKNTSNFNVLSKLDFIEKFKSANKVSIRINNKFGKNDLLFKMDGSLVSINYVISKDYMIKIFKKSEELKKIAEAELDNDVKNLSLLMKLILNNQSVYGKDLEVISAKLYEEYRDYDLSGINEIFINPIELIFNSDYSTVAKLKVNVLLFSKEKRVVGFLNSVDIIETKSIESLISSERKIVYSLLTKYDLTDKERKALFNNIIQRTGSYLGKKMKIFARSPIHMIDSLSLTVQTGRLSYEGFYPDLILYLNDGGKIQCYINKGDSPDFVRKFQLKRKKKLIDKTNSLLKKYNLTSEENIKIINKLNEIDLHRDSYLAHLDIESIKLVKIKIDEIIESATIISFLDKDLKDIYNFEIFWDKIIAKNLKKKIRKAKDD